MPHAFFTSTLIAVTLAATASSAITFEPIVKPREAGARIDLGPSVLPQPEDGTPFLDLLKKGDAGFGLVPLQRTLPPPVLPQPVSPAVVPAPPAALLLLTALGAFALSRRRRPGS